MKQALFVFLMTVSVASAANEELCGDKSGLDRSDCLNELLRVEEGKLNAAYRAAHAQIDRQEIDDVGREEWKRDLDKARLAWSSLRDADCGLVLYDWWGGSGAGNAILACRVQMTKDRTELIGQRWPTIAPTASKAR